MFESFMYYLEKTGLSLTPVQKRIAKVIFDLADSDKEVKQFLMAKASGKDFFFNTLMSFLTHRRIIKSD